MSFPLLPRTGLVLALAATFSVAGVSCATSGAASDPASQPTPAVEKSPVRIVAAPDAVRPPYRFAEQDEALLNDVQRGAFRFLWEECDPSTGMVYDRTSRHVVSVAGVGFQLAALPIGVSRGWITREQAEERATRILEAMLANPENRHAGLFQHYLDPKTAGNHSEQLEHVVSTIDSAILVAGVMVASEYFEKGRAHELAEKLIGDADWRAFYSTDSPRAHERGFISLGWKPKDPRNTRGPGSLLPFYWIDSGCEHRLVTFLGVGASEPQQRVAPETYYRLRRQLGEYPGVGTMVFFPFSGALFTNVFSHCFIDYAGIGAAMGPDDPAKFGVSQRAPVDWWENSRRAVLLHQQKAIEAEGKVPTLGRNAWGLTACDSPTGYLVPGVFPNAAPMPGARPEFDYAAYEAHDSLGDGTIAPYGPGCAILFDPTRSLEALRWMRGLKNASGAALVWRDPATPIASGGGYGFQDSFNLAGEKPWVASDCVSIDQGPLCLAIENARTGMVWELFHKHPNAARAMELLGLRRAAGRSPAAVPGR